MGRLSYIQIYITVARQWDFSALHRGVIKIHYFVMMFRQLRSGMSFNWVYTYIFAGANHLISVMMKKQENQNHFHFFWYSSFLAQLFLVKIWSTAYKDCYIYQLIFTNLIL